jgi:hyperosmotically inducible protein
VWRSPAIDELLSPEDSVIALAAVCREETAVFGPFMRTALAFPLPHRTTDARLKGERGGANMLKRICACAAVLVATASIASASSTQTTDRKDLQVLKDVATSVNRYTQFTIFDDVSANVKDGVVTLTGKVTMPYKRDDITKRVAEVDGVKSVRDDIDVLPVSQFDDRLRARIARSIYGNSNFWNYGIMPNPPIHIIVEHSRVTLTGVVQSDVDRMLAQSLATQPGALSVTNRLKTDAEMQAVLEKSE